MYPGVAKDVQRRPAPAYSAVTESAFADFPDRIPRVLSTLTSAVQSSSRHDELGASVAVLVIVLLAQREVASISGGRWQPLAAGSVVAIAPMVVVFTVSVLLRLAALS